MNTTRLPGRLVPALVALAVLLSACQVHTTVAITTDRSGGGNVQVSVALDPAALAALGGVQALKAQLQDADLVAAGWAVTGPSSGLGSTTVVTATHPFSDSAQAGQLIGSLAGTGTDRPFDISVSSRKSFWRTETTLTGKIDLSCGLDCFGDSGLTKATGSPLGVETEPLLKQAGAQPDQAFTFAVTARLPGSLTRTNAASRGGGMLTWTPSIGRSITLSAVTRTWNSTRIIAAVVAAGVVVVLLGVGLPLWLWRRRRRRRRRSGAHAAIG